ncbi:MAG: tetratricopeptide repeat protein [Bryobacteraceae bacterium]
MRQLALVLVMIGLQPLAYARGSADHLPSRDREGAVAANAGYAGPQACAGCHKEIAASQTKTAMANTWHGAVPASFPRDFEIKTKEGPEPALQYAVLRSATHLAFSTSIPNSRTVTLPVESVVGGKRHGLSFLERIDQVDGIPLERPALIEARYAYNAFHGKLELSPGFETEKPRNYEDALGRILNPDFETKCLTCHAKPETPGSGPQGGVRCENCHGPAADHAGSMAGGNRQVPPILPARLRGAESMNVCAPCHSGTSQQSDPMPDDLLVSNQVPALRNSECFIQSGAGISCTNCHDPHQDSPQVAQRSVAACLQCHSSSVKQHAAICPVNATDGCIGCHMPGIDKGSFRMTDHWIRVHPEQGIKAQKTDSGLRSLVPPKREFLRIIVVGDQQKAAQAAARLAHGESFSNVARQVSEDATAPGGGYIGELELAQMDSKLAAAAVQLQYGETSPVVDLGNRFVILYRMARDFKWQADQLFQQASALKNHGDLKGAISKNESALEIYPYFLRALVFMGTNLGEAGDRRRASEILQFASQTYPKDASTQFDFGLTLRPGSPEQVAAFRRAIELDPNLIASYESLGAALYSSGQPQNAIEVFRKGLEIDPLSAILNYDLGLALGEQGDREGGERTLRLARKLDPHIGATDNRLRTNEKMQ